MSAVEGSFLAVFGYDGGHIDDNVGSRGLETVTCVRQSLTMTLFLATGARRNFLLLCRVLRGDDRYTCKYLLNDIFD